MVEKLELESVNKALEEQRDRIKTDRDKWRKLAKTFDRPNTAMPTYDELLEQKNALENQVNATELQLQQIESSRLTFADGLRYAIAQELDLTGADWQCLIFAHRELTRYEQGWPISEDCTKLGTHAKIYWRTEYESVASMLHGRYRGDPPSDTDRLALTRRNGKSVKSV